MRIALLPGSFDPLHNGHLEVIERAAALFDQVVVAVMCNPAKGQYLFGDDERLAMVEESIADLPNVRVIGFSGLAVDVAGDVGAVAIVKGLRGMADFDSEMQQAQMNRNLSGIETLFMPTSAANGFVASRLLREVARLGGEVGGLVPEPVLRRIEKKMADNKPTEPTDKKTGE